jgi:PE family protein
MGGLIGVDAPLLGLSSAIQGATAGTMAGTTAGAAPEVTAVLPPGGDGASAAAAAGLSARGAAAIAMLTDLTTSHALFADTVGVSGLSYTAQDGINQVALAVGDAL